MNIDKGDMMSSFEDPINRVFKNYLTFSRTVPTVKETCNVCKITKA
jgi:hypothetical protein